MAHYEKKGSSTDLAKLHSRFISGDGVLDERALLAECRRGDSAALCFLFQHYAKPIENGAKNALEKYPHIHSDELPDLVQAVCARIIEAPNKRLSSATGEIHHVSSWLCTVAMNFSLNELESSNRSELKKQPDVELEDVARPTGIATDSDEIHNKFEGLSSVQLCIVEALTVPDAGTRQSILRRVAKRYGISMRQMRREVAIIKKRILRGDFS